MAFLNDTFTDVAGTELSAHVGESGTWTKHASSGATTLIISDAGRLYANGLNSIYYASGVPLSAEYNVEWTTRYAGTPAADKVAPGVTARHSTAADTFYLARLSHDQLELYKRVAGTFTLLGSYAFVPVVGVDYSLRLEIRDATKKVYLDGVERISSADNSITDAGRVGVRGNTSTAASNTTGGHIDNVIASLPEARVYQEAAEAAVTGQTTDARVHQENVEAAVTGQTTDARVYQHTVEVAVEKLDVGPNQTVEPPSIVPAEAFGTPSVFDPNLLQPTGIASGEQFGAVTVFRGLVKPTGITSRQAFGTPSLNSPQYVQPVGIPSLEDQGIVTVNGPVVKKTYTIKLGPGKRGIPSAEAVGTPQVNGGALTPPSIPSSEAFGTPNIVTPGFVSPAGIASAEVVPAPGIVRDAVVAPVTITSAEAFGTPGIVRAGTIAPAGIESAEAVGEPTLTVLPQTVAPTAISSSEVVNPVTVIQRTAHIVAPPSIGSGLVFGTPTIVLGAPGPIEPDSIVSREAFGLPRINLSDPTGPGPGPGPGSGGPAGRIANRLYNVAGGVNFAFAINHSEEEALVLRRQYEPGAPTTVNLVRHQSAADPPRLTLRGTILDPAQKAALDVLYDFCDQDTLTYEDYAQEAYEVIITSWDARMERAHNPLTRGLHIWRFTLELEVVSVIAGSLPNSGVSI